MEKSLDSSHLFELKGGEILKENQFCIHLKRMIKGLGKALLEDMGVVEDGTQILMHVDLMVVS